MASYLWYSWDLPLIYLHLITILVVVFIICIIVWIISFFIRPILARRRRPQTARSDRIGVMDEFEEEHMGGDYDELVIQCVGCQASIEVRTTRFPVKVKCGVCGVENTAK